MSFHLWIVLVSTTFESDIFNALIKKGYSVSPASGGDICLTFDNAPCAIFAVKLDKDKLIREEVYSDCMMLLSSIGAKFYGIVISEYSPNSIWNGPNFWATDILNEPSDKEQRKRLN